jgi:hypothetical protein
MSSSTEAPLAPILRERLDGDVNADLIPILETVGYGFCRRCDPNLDALDGVRFYTVGECRPRKPDHAQRWPVCAGLSGFDSERDPDFVRRLRGDLVKAESREKAHDAGRDPHACLDERVMVGDLARWSGVQSASDPFEDALCHEPAECDPIDALGF